MKLLLSSLFLFLIKMALWLRIFLLYSPHIPKMWLVHPCCDLPPRGIVTFQIRERGSHPNREREYICVGLVMNSWVATVLHDSTHFCTVQGLVGGWMVTQFRVDLALSLIVTGDGTERPFCLRCDLPGVLSQCKD